MTTTYTWSIVKMEAYSNYYEHDNVVFNVHWTLTAEDGEFTASVYGSQNLSLDIDDDDFTAYEDLTQLQVVDWLLDSLGQNRVDELEENLAENIENQKNPPVVSPPLPWSVA